MKKIEWLTGFKGVLAMLVFVHHFYLFYYPYFSYGVNNIDNVSPLVHGVIYSPFNILGFGGELAVSCFFVISGFLICYKFNTSDKKSSPFKDVVNRYFRLLIPVFISMTLIYIVLATGVLRIPNIIDSLKKIGLISYYSDFNCNYLSVIYESIIGVFTFGSSYISPQLWTMSCELKGSIFMILFYSLFNEKNKSIFLYPIIIIAFYNTTILPFIFGGMIADLYFNKNEIMNYLKKWDIKIILLLSALYFMSFTYLISDKFIYKWLGYFNSNDIYGLTHYIGALLLLLFLLVSNISKKVLSNKMLVFLGNISLEIYLYHWVIINTISMYITYFLLKYFSYFYSSLITLIITTILVISFSYLINKRMTPINKVILSKINNRIN